MISIEEARPKLNNLGARRIRVLCASGRISGAKLIGGTWVLPDVPVITPAGRTRPSKADAA